jgi:anaerobic dimethyl sulfoxide reductase subunit C (anchor subunit)
MIINEWALVVFTILTQMAFGAFFLLWIIHAVARRRIGVAEADRLSNPTFLAIPAIQGAALLISLGHLSQIMRAHLAVTHLGTSWLSAEVSFAIATFLVVGLFGILQWFKATPNAFRSFLGILGMLLGIGTIYSMSRVYMIATVAPWNTFETMTSFYVASFLMGSLFVGTALTITHRALRLSNEERAEWLGRVQSGLGIAALALLGVEFIVTPLYLTVLATGSATDRQAVTLLENQYRVIFAVRLFLLFLGAGIFAMLIYRNALKPEWRRRVAGFTYAAFAIVLASEVLRRFLFYVMRIRTGLP